VKVEERQNVLKSLDFAKFAACGSSFLNFLRCISEPRQTTPNSLTGGSYGGKEPYNGVKGGPERALLVVKGCIRWRKGRIRLQRGKVKGTYR